MSVYSSAMVGGIRWGVPQHLLRRNVNRTIDALRTGDLLFVQMHAKCSSPLEKAIWALSNCTIDWLKERGSAITKKDTCEHVAMVIAEGEGNNRRVSLVEAMKGKGVQQVPLQKFLNSFGSRARFFHGTVRDASDAEVRHAAASFAIDKLGLPYADDYAPPSEAGEYYCSSLVDYAYRHALNVELPFSPYPFPLMFEPISFWERHYQDLQVPIPSFIGSNPTLLLHSSRVKYYETVLGPAAAAAKADTVTWSSTRKQPMEGNVHLQYALQYGLYH